MNNDSGASPHAAGSVLVTGSAGFVGRHLCAALSAAGYSVRPVARSASDQEGAVTIGGIGAETDWSAALDKISYVIHLAARVHVMKDMAADPLGAFRAVNVAGTASLARAAAKTGVQRFVYVSSIKVNGEKTAVGQPFSEQDAPAPMDAYGVSKWEAEQAVMQIASEAGMAYSIVRPPLIYGAGVKGNFLTMLNWLYRSVPLPLGSVHNQRSLIGIGNFVDFLIRCLQDHGAVNQLFLVSDGEDLSTPDLIQWLARGLERKPVLLPCPEPLLCWPARLIGREAVVNRLTDSLQVDIGKARSMLGWQPPVSVAVGLMETARWYQGVRGDNRTGS